MGTFARLGFVFANSLAIACAQSSPQGVIDAARAAEQSAGVRPTGNFSHHDSRVSAYFRCYYTGTLELPGSYDSLKLRQGTRDGCSLDYEKYDVFFYPIEAVASGHSPITEALEKAAPERIAMLVPHEDFHSQIEALPDRIAEAAATLAGFLVPSLEADAELFLQKSLIVNRHYDELRAVYQGKLPKRSALEKKQAIFAAIDRECAAIQGEPRSFNKRLSASNNAGLAFDYTYTKYYPLLYKVWMGCSRDSKCAVGAMLNAPKKRSEQETAAYFQALIQRQTGAGSDPYR